MYTSKIPDASFYFLDILIVLIPNIFSRFFIIRGPKGGDAYSKTTHCLISFSKGSKLDTAQTLNAAEFFVGGVNHSRLADGLPGDAQFSLKGCVEAPRFMAYNTPPRGPPPQLDFSIHVKEGRCGDSYNFLLSHGFLGYEDVTAHSPPFHHEKYRICERLVSIFVFIASFTRH